MSRRIDITASPEMRTRIVNHVQELPGIASITLHRGASISPTADLLTIDATNNAALGILKFLDEAGALEAGSVTISEPTAVIAAGETRAIDREGNEAIWEEVGALMRRDTNPSPNFLLLMMLSGAVASVGLVTDTIHVVVGAMLIAPGFEPLLRIIFGFLGHRYNAKAGLGSTCAGYALLAVGAGLGMAVALPLHGITAAELADLHWVNYWSKVEATGVAVSLFAGIAGGVIVATRMTVLATGVMVALALVPSMALVGMGLGSGNLDLTLGALTRWCVEVLCVLTAGGATFALKWAVLHRRRHASRTGGPARGTAP